MRFASAADAPAGRAVAAGDRAVARAALDCSFLVAVLAISLLPYVGGLGFYYDDYSVLERMHAAGDHSLGGLYDAVRPATGQRPLQALLFAALYRLFGLDATGYHAVNACLLAAIAILLYLVLRELGLPRLLCVALPLVYSVLPHYATDRFWVDAFQINLSSFFFLASSYFALRALRARPVALVVWLVLAALCVAGSLFAYEVAFPLYVLVVALLWSAGRRREVTRGARWIAIGSITAAALVAGIVKTTLVAEHGQNAYQLGVQSGLAHHLAYLVSGSLKVSLGTYLVAAPYVVWWIVRHRLSSADVGAALAAGAVAFVYLRGIGARDAHALADERPWRSVTGVGVVAWLLGYAIFLTNDRVLFRSAGIDNRVNAAAALGVAAVAVGGVGWLVARLPGPRRAAVFSATVACVVAFGVLVVASVGGFWTEAARRQQAIVSSLRQEEPVLPSGSTVILDGVCPETGPAVVFADQWDFRGAIDVAYGESSLVADTATDGLHAGFRRLALTMPFLGTESTRTYAYGPRLFVYDFPRRAVHQLLNRREAAQYLSSRHALDCAPQRGFAWGFDPFSRTSLP